MGCPPTGVKAKDAARLGYDLARCLVDEDAPAGCAIIGVEGTHDAADLFADLVVASLDKLRIVVQHNGVRFEFLPE